MFLFFCVLDKILCALNSRNLPKFQNLWINYLYIKRFLKKVGLISNKKWQPLKIHHPYLYRNSNSTTKKSTYWPAMWVQPEIVNINHSFFRKWYLWCVCIITKYLITIELKSLIYYFFCKRMMIKDYPKRL